MTLRRTGLLTVVATLFLGSTAFAQPQPNLPLQREAMKKRAFLVGQWQGGASITRGPGGPIQGFEWGYTAGPAKVSNRMVIDENGRWIEHTDVVVNNGPPQRVVEMRLSKGQ